MKISMWMIANRLKDYDIEINIKDNAEASLKSVRFIPIDHCVHVIQKEGDVVCTGEEDTIILRNMSVDGAFEIIADIFDFYDDWDYKMREYAEKFDFTTIIDDCWQVFNNPITFIGNNKKVLAMSNQYGIDDVNDEWRYTKLHGHVSIDNLKKTDFSTHNYYVSHIYRFHSLNELDFMTCPVLYDNVACARILVIEKDRRINIGDEQLLNHLVTIIAPVMMRLESNEHVLLGQNTLLLILKNFSVSTKEIQRFLDYHNWNDDDTFRVCVLTLKPEDTMDSSLLLIQQDVSKLLPDCPSLIFEDKVIIVFNEDVTPCSDNIKSLKSLKSLNIDKNMIISVSLPFHDLKYMRMYWKQALSAFKYGKLYRRRSNYFDFYDYALDYIIDSGIAEDVVFACHPDVSYMYKNKLDSINTIHSYLNNKCSLLHTAEELYVHRNTLVYRIKKIIDGMKYNIEDSYTREYMSLSIRILTLNHHKQNNC